MFLENGTRVKFNQGGDSARIQKVQVAYGKDLARAPRVVSTNDSKGARQIQVVTGGDAARFPFVNPLPAEAGAPAAWFQQGKGITVTGLGVSTWADQSGNGRDLLQGTDANRPINLPYTGSRYLYLPGVTGNNATTPDIAGNSFSGDVDLRVRVSLDDWTPSATQTFIAKWLNVQRAYVFQISATGALLFAYSADGSVARLATASAATGITDGAASWIRVTYATATGKVNFYKAADSETVPSSWAAIGTEQTITAGAIFNSNQTVMIGQSQDTGSELPALGKIYRALGYSTIGGSSPAFDFNASDATDGAASFPSLTTGETWTVNTSGGKPAQIVGRSSILFDGAAHFLLATYTSAQPRTRYLLLKQVSWTLGDRICGGSVANAAEIVQSATTPRIRNVSPTVATEDAGLAVGTYGVICSIFNGASSFLSVNNGTGTTSDAGGTAAGAFAIGARGDGTSPANIQVLEALDFGTSHSSTVRAQVVSYLAGIGSVAL